MRFRAALAVMTLVSAFPVVSAAQAPVRARDGMVVSQNEVASRAGVDVLQEGGKAIDAAIATALALAVTHPTAGNIGGGGFIVYRPRCRRAGGVRLPRDGPRPRPARGCS